VLLWGKADMTMLKQFLRNESGATAPKNTPADIIDKLNREVNAALVDPKITRIADAEPARLF
jgi:hypothetical protein